MLTFLACVLTGATLIILVPVAAFTTEVIAAVVSKLQSKSLAHHHGPRPRIAVLIPAHDEGAGLMPTIGDVNAQLRPGDRLVVIADNCTDDTARVAQSAGADVIERQDPERHGKGYALDWGLRHLQTDPPEIVIMVDADCRLSERDALDWLALTCKSTGRPVQALYRMNGHPDAEATAGQRAAQFAWIVKSHVRPTGLATLGLPCQLMGTGMAFPWKAIHSVNLASENLVEDLKLGLDLAAIGAPPLLCPHTHVESTFPFSAVGTLTQRRRWEIGSLRILVRDAPIFACKALADGNFPLFILALDAMIPPLVVLFAVLVGFLLLAVLGHVAGATLTPLYILAAALSLFASAILLAWVVYGRRVLRLRDAGALLAHLLQKLRIYRPQDSHWVRTDRH